MPKQRKGGKRGDRVRDHLRDLIRTDGAGAKSELARRLGVNQGRITDWESGIALPGAESLWRFGDALGVSIDWFLGFDVPKRREERAAIGALAGELRAELVRWRPWATGLDLVATSHGRPGLLLHGEDARLVREVVACWWRERFRKRVLEMAGHLLSLSDLIRHDAGRDEHQLVAQLMVRSSRSLARHAQRLRRDPNHLFGGVESDFDSNQVVRDALFPLVLKEIGQVLWAESVVEAIDREQLVTKFAVPYGEGFSYRGASSDHVWFHDRESGQATHQRGRFLEREKQSRVLRRDSKKHDLRESGHLGEPLAEGEVELGDRLIAGLVAQARETMVNPSYFE